MPTPSKGPRLGGGPAHERLMLANLATALFQHGRITTTEAKAKRLRPLAERLISKAKRGDLHNRRQVMRVINDRTKKRQSSPADIAVHKLFTEIAPRYENRNGGYTRIVKIGPRKGDNAPMAVIELVEELVEAAPERPAKKAAKTAKKAAPRKKAAAQTESAEQAAPEQAPAEAAPAEDATANEAAAPAEPEDAASEDTAPPGAGTDGTQADTAEGEAAESADKEQS